MTEPGGESTLVDQLDGADTGPVPDLSAQDAAVDPPEPAEPELTEPVERADTDELPLFGPDGAVIERPGPVAVAPFHHALIHPISLLVAAVAGGGLAYAVDHSSRVAVIAVAAMQGLLIVSWLLGSAVIGRIGALVVATGAAVASDVLITHHPHGELGALLAVVGLAPAVLFAHQLVRGRRRHDVVASLSGIALLVVATTALAALLQLRHQVDGPAMTVAVVLCLTAALVVGHLVDWIWSPLRFDPHVSRGLPAFVASVIAGAAVTGVKLRHSTEFTEQRAVLIGAALAAIAGLLAVGAAFVAAPAPPLLMPNVTTIATPITTDRPDRLIGRIARPIFTTTFVFAFTAPFAYLLCLAFRN